MTVRIPKKLHDYFKSPKVLLVAVNNIAAYMNLSRLQSVCPSISYQNSVPIEVDEGELADELLKDETLFVLLAMYAMGVGE